jgi:serpin B
MHGLRALVVLVALAACSDGVTPPGEPITELPRALTASEESVIAASNVFGIELLRRVVAGDDRANVVLSPLSASMALGMTLNGAASTTFDGMSSTLGFGGLTQEEINASYRGLIELLTELDPTVTFEIANAIWANQGFPFHEAFFQAVDAAFDARAETRDFADPATVSAINAWVDDRTHGLIDSIVDSLDPALVMLLVNAIYYEAIWTNRFDPGATGPAPFARDDGTSVTVDMMRVDEPEVPFRWGPDYAAVELPYGGQAFSMIVVVPTGDATVRDLVAELDPAAWEALLDGLGVQKLAYVELPKFTLTYDGFLNDALEGMGMEEAFAPGADFTNMSPLGDQLCISYVRQKTYIEVDERGTRAAAVTAVGVGVTSAPPGFVADRPFLFAIRERLSSTLLFAGVVGDPTAEDPGPGEATSDCG